MQDQDIHGLLQSFAMNTQSNRNAEEERTNENLHGLHNIMSKFLSYNNERKIIAFIYHMFEKDDKDKSSMTPEERLKHFNELARIMHIFVPNELDSSLLEIDYLLYPDDDLTLPTNGSGGVLVKCTESLKKIDYDNWLSRYRAIYDDLALSINSRLLDTTYLQLLHCTYVEHSKQSTYNTFSLANLLSTLPGVYADFLNSMDATKLCFYLKMLKVGAGKLDYDHDILLSLQMIPEAKHPVKKKITSFIRKLAHEVGTRSRSNGFYIHSAAFNSDFIKELYKKYIKYSSFEPDQMANRCYFFNMLHKFFVSAENDDERLKRITDFIDGLFHKEYYYDNLLIHKVITRLEPLTDLIKVVDELLNLLKYAMEKCKHMDDIFRYIERNNGYDIKPYLSAASTNGVVTKGCDNIETNDGTKDSRDSEEADYTMEKYFWYDNIMKWLHVMSILNTACEMRKDIRKVCFQRCLFGFVQGRETLVELVQDLRTAFSDCEILRHNNTFIKKYVNKALIDPTQRGKIPWLIEITVKKCPFLVLPPQQSHLIKDLLKMLQYIEIDEVTEENLFMALSVPRGFKDVFILDSPYRDVTVRYHIGGGDNYGKNMLDMIELPKKPYLEINKEKEAHSMLDMIELPKKPYLEINKEKEAHSGRRNIFKGIALFVLMFFMLIFFKFYAF